MVWDITNGLRVQYNPRNLIVELLNQWYRLGCEFYSTEDSATAFCFACCTVKPIMSTETLIGERPRQLAHDIQITRHASDAVLSALMTVRAIIADVTSNFELNNLE